MYIGAAEQRYLWVAVALIDCAVGTEKVQILLAVYVPGMHALGPAENYR